MATPPPSPRDDFSRSTFSVTRASAQSRTFGVSRASLAPRASHLAQEIDSIRAVARAIANSAADGYIRSSALYPPQRAAASRLHVGVERAPFYLAGRYRKFSRSLPQSPWLIDGKCRCAAAL